MRFIAVTSAVFVAAFGSVEAQDSSRGQDLFLRHCATCHGSTAQGDGPMAAVLSIPPADLTVLADDNGGAFPAGKVVRRIDGEIEVLAHGGPMPLFGLVMQGPSGVVVASDGSEIITSEAIVDMAAWLEEIQQ
ncbi:MAG: c-type cytochrome [Boseongicola sp.]